MTDSRRSSVVLTSTAMAAAFRALVGRDDMASPLGRRVARRSSRLVEQRKRGVLVGEFESQLRGHGLDTVAERLLPQLGWIDAGVEVRFQAQQRFVGDRRGPG